jgi:hypothetical protein
MLRLKMQRFLNQFFNNKGLEKILPFFNSINWSQNNWTLLLINKNFFQNSPFTREIDVYCQNDLFQAKISKNINSTNNQPKEIICIEQFKNQSRILKKNIKDMIELSALKNTFNKSIDEGIYFEITHFIKILSQSETLIGAKPSEKEEKSLEWIKVSFQTLLKAITEFENNKLNTTLLNDETEELSFQLFFGLNPKLNMHEFRIIIFNLDIQYILLNDHNLRIRIYNTVDGSVTKSLEGDFHYRRREAFDQLIKLLDGLKKEFHL